MEEKEQTIQQKAKTEAEKIIKNILEEGIRLDNIETLYKAVDIHKDMANEEYWKAKEEIMRYRGYGRESYGRDSYGNDSYGRRYGNRSYSGKYGKAEEMLDRMSDSYGRYSESREYGRGNYGHDNKETLKSLDYMLQSTVDFLEMLEEDAGSQEEMELIKKYTKYISEM